MTDQQQRCAPVDGTERRSGHWIRDSNGTLMMKVWDGSHFIFAGFPFSPERLHEFGYRYDSPVATPDEVAALTERARGLEAENEGLRQALHEVMPFAEHELAQTIARDSRIEIQRRVDLARAYLAGAEARPE